MERRAEEVGVGDADPAELIESKVAGDDVGVEGLEFQRAHVERVADPRQPVLVDRRHVAGPAVGRALVDEGETRLRPVAVGIGIGIVFLFISLIDPDTDA